MEKLGAVDSSFVAIEEVNVKRFTNITGRPLLIEGAIRAHC